MERQHVEAIYENGMFKPLSPVHLVEHQRVSIVIDGEEREEEFDSEEYIPLAAENGDPDITWKQVHAALANIPGSLADQIIRDREERF